MKHIAKTLTGIALACCVASSMAQAASIQSLTIEEIGVTSGGIGTSGLAGGGGWGNFFTSPSTYLAAAAFFTSNGSDGTLLMGTAQANGAFSTGFTWGGSHYEFNTLKGAPADPLQMASCHSTCPVWLQNLQLGIRHFPPVPMREHW